MNELVIAVLIAAVGGGGLSAVVIKILDRPQSRANADRTQVETALQLLTEVRSDVQRKDAKIDELEARIEKLEERERHMLTRAAVHEAWDQLAFQSLLAQNPSHPPPPPLAMRRRPDGGPEAS